MGAWVARGPLPRIRRGGEPRRRLLSFNSSFPSLDQVYRFRSASEKQVWQRLFTGGEGKGAHPGGASAHGDSQALPPGCSAGEVRAAPGARPPALTASARPEGGKRDPRRPVGHRQAVEGPLGRRRGLPGRPAIKSPPAMRALIPGSGRSPGGGNGNPLQYSCLGNPMDRGVRRATVHGVAESQTQLSK